MKVKSILQILMLSAVWGISFLMMRVALPIFPPLWIALLRCTLGASLMWSVLLLRDSRLPPKRLLGWLLLVAILNNAVPFSLIAWGERWVPSNVASVLNATVPIWTLLLSVTVDRTLPRWLTSVGVLLAFLGVLLVVLSHAPEPLSASDPGGTGLFGGTVAIGAAAVSYAVASLVAKAKLRGLDPMGLATTQLSLAAVLLLPIALLGTWPSNFLAPGPLGAIAVLGFAGSGFAYLLYYKLLAEVSATQVVAVTYLLPIWGVFWGLIAGEAIGIPTYAGLAITLLGLILLNWRPPRTA